METKGALFALGNLGRGQGQPEGPAAFPVDGLDLRPDLLKVAPDAGGAVSQTGRNEAISAAAAAAGDGHLKRIIVLAYWRKHK
jgi:hypothetical protein